MVSKLLRQCVGAKASANSRLNTKLTLPFGVLSLGGDAVNQKIGIATSGSVDTNYLASVSSKKEFMLTLKRRLGKYVFNGESISLDSEATLGVKMDSIGINKREVSIRAGHKLGNLKLTGGSEACMGTIACDVPVWHAKDCQINSGVNTQAVLKLTDKAGGFLPACESYKHNSWISFKAPAAEGITTLTLSSKAKETGRIVSSIKVYTSRFLTATGLKNNFPGFAQFDLDGRIGSDPILGKVAYGMEFSEGRAAALALDTKGDLTSSMSVSVEAVEGTVATSTIALSVSGTKIGELNGSSLSSFKEFMPELSFSVDISSIYE